MSQFQFDASKVAPAQALEPVPTGWYVATMTASEIKENSKKNGKLLEAEYTIASPDQYKGRKLYDRFNIENPNQQAVEIGYAQLSAVCHAVGVIQMQDSSQLHNRPLQVRAVLSPAEIGADGKAYEARNEVRGYKALDLATSTAAPVAAPASFTPPPVAAAPTPAPAPAVAAPATPAPAPAAPAPVVVDWKTAASSDGWKPHPQSAGWWYKDKEVKSEADVEALFSSPAAPEIPSAPAAPTAPVADWANQTPSQPAAAPAQAAPAEAPVAAPIPEAGEVPPWMKK